MNTHVWVPGMYIRPPSPEEQQSLASEDACSRDY